MTAPDQERNPHPAPGTLDRITLIGFRGCGKSTVGAALAAALAWPLIDADTVLEQRLGCTIASLFARDGEAAFRVHESECLRAILATPAPWVLATGGGVVLNEENRIRLATDGGLIVYLEADAPTLQARLTQQPHRPSLTGAGAVEEVPRLLAQRQGFYAALAQLTVPAIAEPAETAARLMALVVDRR